MVDKNQHSESAQLQEFYEYWPFPGTDFFSHEGLLLLRYLQKWIGSVEEDRKSPARIIDIGCGTGQTTMALAEYFPHASFWGIDISSVSIRSARTQAAARKLANITFLCKDVREDLSEMAPFTIVLCLGALHHIRESRAAFARITQLLEREGYLILWLYGRLGRFHHNMNQEFLRLLGRDQDNPDRLKLASAFLEHLGDPFALGTGFYTPKGTEHEGLAWLLERPQWIADQMMPAFEHGVTISEILQLFDDNGLGFRKWLGIPTHLKAYTSSEVLLARYAKLSPREQLTALDLLLKPAYYFVTGQRF